MGGNRLAKARAYLNDIQTAVLAVSLLSVGMIALQLPYGLSLWDEGYLWYGAQAILRGEVPLRDFMAYDPLRYYWASLFMKLTGSDGILPVRYSLMVVQCASVSMGAVLILGREKLNGWRWLVILGYGILATLWMLPRHKSFDIFASVALVFTTYRVLLNPSKLRFFIAGVIIGGLAVLGRNHGVYGVVGFAVAVAMTSVMERKVISVKHLLAFVTGIVLGFSPQLFMSLLIPGYWAALRDSVLFIFEMGATNLPLPIPWPWRAFTYEGASRQILELATGLLFLAVGIFVTAPVVLRGFKEKSQEGKRVRVGLVACASLSLPYAHYAYSRADVGHLALGIYPFLTGLFLLMLNARWGIRIVMGGGVILALVVPLKYVIAPWNIGHFVRVEIQKEQLWVEPYTHSDIQLIEEVARRFSSRDDDLAFVPYWPGAYAVLRKTSPIWEIYGVVARSEEFQRRELALLRRNDPRAILIWNYSLDSREDLQYRQTHGLIYEFIRANFEQDKDVVKGLPYELYLRH